MMDKKRIEIIPPAYIRLKLKHKKKYPDLKTDRYYVIESIRAKDNDTVDYFIKEKGRYYPISIFDRMDFNPN